MRYDSVLTHSVGVDLKKLEGLIDSLKTPLDQGYSTYKIGCLAKRRLGVTAREY